MPTKTITWADGSTATLTYTGQGNGTITVQSDPNNNYESRSAQVTVRTTDGSNISKIITVVQAAKVRTDISTAIVTAANQTYSGSALTPTPTVTLNGVAVPSSGYDVAYSNNTNAGTATITITGKNDYTGTATGTFTIAKASRTLSFTDSYAVVAPSGNVTKTATPSAGSGDGAITYSISSTTYATIDSSSGKVTAKTSDGSAVVTATIAEGTNYLSATASYNLYVFATTHNYDYNGSYRSVTLPPGTYQFQCWGAQGGSNAAASTYSITAKAGGKGGYSVGQLTVSQATAIRVYVGGQGSSSAAGYNGGGSTTGSSSYSGGDTYGTSRMGGGGGATDIRLSDGALLSRMIVAGGGSGGAMTYKKVTTSTTSWEQTGSLTFHSSGTINGISLTAVDNASGSNYITRLTTSAGVSPITAGTKVKINFSEAVINRVYWSNGSTVSVIRDTTTASSITFTMTAIPGNAYWLVIQVTKSGSYFSGTGTVYEEKTTSTTTESNDSQIGYAGGGENGVGYNSDYYGKQNAAGYRGSFGQGANQTNSARISCSAAGGGGWYGGGGGEGDSSVFYAVRMSGGGSGWVNTAASAGNRPSGYTGLQLDSGTTYAGNTSFVAPGGGNETGHAGNGYARITRL